MDSPDARNVPSWLDIKAARPAGVPTVAEAIEAGFTHGPGEYPARGAALFEAGGTADVMEPCSVLAELTGQALDAGMSRLTDDELVGVLQAARRVISWQTAVELAAVEELAARREAAHEGFPPSPDERASAELAVALTLTRRSADRMLDFAANLARLQAVTSALSRGEIDPPRAEVFADELAMLPWLQASFIAAKHILAARELTTSQLRALLRRAVLEADPEAGHRLQREARKDARVEAWSEGSGNGALAGRELPAAGALLADKHLTALATSLRQAGAPGTLDQVRAEVFLALLSGQSPEALLAARRTAPQSVPDEQVGAAREHAAWPAPAAGTAAWPAGPTGVVHLTMPLGSWLGLSDRPGTVAGHGPADVWMCRELAAAMADWQTVRYCVSITTPAGQPLGHACTSRPPPVPVGARSPGRGPAPPDPGPPPGVWSGSEGMPPSVAEWLRSLKIEWLRTSGCDHSRETAAYRPGRVLDHLLKIRNQTCTAPGCGRRAQRCDIDHVIPHHLGGKTCECNCHPLCRRHHRCKGSAGWRLDMPEPGVLSWQLPHGRTYLSSAEPYPV